MNAGSLNRRITIQKRMSARDEAGQPIESWADVGQCWADIKGQTGLGSITGMQDNVPASVERYSVRVRYREDVQAGMRAMCNGTAFYIKQVRMDFAGRVYTDLVCEVGGK